MSNSSTPTAAPDTLDLLVDDIEEDLFANRESNMPCFGSATSFSYHPENTAS
ncbi:hypothetical protein [Thermostaphylospora chromogena]|uniref:Uncharacterized protein n=1 Tax=Thermostaphylospora chromogena TaxID=35622 RepID=A0A1H1FVM4_9ACTN|nr:hypothetical protein [Thermostaphylospora chromogena]SDR04596.1 hypothetical protein SAMN04489764_3191 [Thermostaphylospora chromogena]